jgi:type II secretory pathway pseudopilin PulG
MNSYTAVERWRATRRGITLLDLLVVITAIAILVILVLGASPEFRWRESAARNRTVSTHSAIMAALEQYKERHGAYPESANPKEEADFSGHALPIGGSHMLYQATTGDGSSAIVMESPRSTGASESDGKVSDDELQFSLSGIYFPKSILYPPNIPAGTVQPRLLVDGWGRPFQYTKADPDPAKNKAVNSTYDLWSMGPKPSSPLSSDSLASKRDEKVSGSWIKNW